MKSLSTGFPGTGSGTFCRRAFIAVATTAMFVGATSRTFAQVAIGDGSVADRVRRPVLVIVSLEVQRAFVYRNGVLIGISTASTGKPGHETPTGIFTILQKQVDHNPICTTTRPCPSCSG